MSSKLTILSLRYFANLLSIARKEKGLSIDELRSRVGVSKPTIIKILQGDGGVAIETYFEAASILGIPLFDSDDGRLSGRVKESEKLLSLLPSRIRKKEMKLDDNF
ncbi:helix-turn-helix transcriptional regulator [Colwellia sp. E150_009]